MDIKQNKLLIQKNNKIKNIIGNKLIKLTEKYPDKEWNWYELSKNENIHLLNGVARLGSTLYALPEILAKQNVSLPTITAKALTYPNIINITISVSVIFTSL